MNCPYKITIGNKKLYREFTISENMDKVCLGTTSGCEFRLNSEEFFDDIELTFIKNESVWQIASSDSIYLSAGDSRKLRFSKIQNGDTFTVRYASNGSDIFELGFTIDFEAQIPVFTQYIDISNVKLLNIGADETMDMVLNSPYSTNTQLCIGRDGERYYVEEINSQYGIYINGRRIMHRTFLDNYDFVSACDIFLYFKENYLYYNPEKVKIKGLQHRACEPESIFKYPIFVRNTRRKMKLDTRPIKVLDPNVKPKKPEMHIVTSLMPAIIMFVLVVVLRGIMSTTIGTYIIFSICSMALGVFTSIAGLVQGQKKYKSDVKKRETVYRQYIKKKEKEIWEAREAEIAVLTEMYYSPIKGIDKVMNFESDIFDRIAEDSDFLDVYVGTGRRISTRQIDYKRQEKLQEGDELTNLPQELCEKYMFINNTPITLSMRDSGVVGITGSKEKRYMMFKNILADIICRQFFTEVSIYLLLDDEVDKYDWVKKLPQIQQSNGMRNIVFDNNSKTMIFEDLFKELTFRKENKRQYKHIIIFLLDENGITKHPLSKFIKQAKQLQTTFIFFEKRVDFLPLYCTSIIELGDSCRGELYNSQDKTSVEHFTYETIADEKMEALVKMVAPVYSEEISLASALKKNISMYQLLGIYAASDIDLAENWSNAKVYNTMAVPLGVNEKNETVYLDLHEKAHGPHGLIAGTTGSGKSEILQSYILSAALKFHPYEVSFVIIDFKGGGMANQFKKLPHMLGAITNIDGKEINRSLKSIKAELLRRQELFAKADVNQIDKYIRLYKTGGVKIPLPHLIIIVDEFAELKAEQPEFMKELISAARIGRSLGVHLILATQKPAGQVNEQIWSNSRFKLCLKVQDQQDSKEVIKSPLAAEIKEPGRAYLQVGNNEIFELFQSAYSGAPSIREDDATQKRFAIYKYGLAGRTGVLFEQKKIKTKKTADTELEALVKQIATFCTANAIEKLPNICLPGLGEFYPFQNERTKDSLMYVPIGLYDDPDHQYQGVYSADFGNENTIIIGGAQTGKTNLLQLCIRYLAMNHSPEDVNFYIMDFGSMILKNFEGLNHVGGVVSASEDEKVKNLFKLLSREMDARKTKLVATGVSSFQSYREAGFTDMPKIYLMLDNFNAFKELYMDEYEPSFVRVCRDGISLGISILITNTSSTGIGYRHLSNFSNRICFTCNDVSDYSTMLTRCRMEPAPFAGRMLFQKDKEIFEAQTYMAFEGEKEINRAKAVRQFVTDMNDTYKDYESARQIPCIPNQLSCEDFRKTYFHMVDWGEIPMGLDFATIEPVVASVREDFEFAVISKKREYIYSFIRSFCKTAQIYAGNTELRFYVIDNVERSLKYLKDNPFTHRYSIEVSESELILDDIFENVTANKYHAISEHRESGRYITSIVILNSRDAIEYISKTKPVLEKFKEIVGGYKNYGVLFLYTEVENTAVSYSGPELLKRIKDNKKVMLLDNINTLKIFDILPAQMRAFSKEILSDEGYWISGTEIKKIKLFKKEA